MLKANHLSQQYDMEDSILREFPQQIASCEQRIAGYLEDIKTLQAHPQSPSGSFCAMEIHGRLYTEKKLAGAAILNACQAMKSTDPVPLGKYRGFPMELGFNAFCHAYTITLHGALHHTTDLGADIFGNIQRLDNLLAAFPEKLTACRENLKNVHAQLAYAKLEIQKPFPHEEELNQKSARLDELNVMLSINKGENEILDGEPQEESPDVQEKKSLDTLVEEVMPVDLGNVDFAEPEMQL